MIATKPFEERLADGTGEEDIIAERWKPRLLTQYGATLEKVEKSEDMSDKIDRWLTTAKGTRLGVQIKFRESGDDILVEIIKNLPRWEDGRDVVGIADLYLCVDRNRMGRLYQTKHIKPAATALRDLLKKDILENPQQRWWNPEAPYDKWSVNVGPDPESRVLKVRGFFVPDCYPFIAFPNL